MTPDYLYFDETPDQCPGCGNVDHVMPDGPSHLMITWMALANSYLCIDCRQQWATWDINGSSYPEGRVPDARTPVVVKNLELIAKGEEPNYVSSARTFPQPPVAGGFAPVVA